MRQDGLLRHRFDLQQVIELLRVILLDQRIEDSELDTIAVSRECFLYVACDVQEVLAGLCVVIRNN